MITLRVSGRAAGSPSRIPSSYMAWLSQSRSIHAGGRVQNLNHPRQLWKISGGSRKRNQWNGRRDTVWRQGATMAAQRKTLTTSKQLTYLWRDSSNLAKANPKWYWNLTCLSLKNRCSFRDRRASAVNLNQVKRREGYCCSHQRLTMSRPRCSTADQKARNLRSKLNGPSNHISRRLHLAAVGIHSKCIDLKLEPLKQG